MKQSVRTYMFKQNHEKGYHTLTVKGAQTLTKQLARACEQHYGCPVGSQTVEKLGGSGKSVGYWLVMPLEVNVSVAKVDDLEAMRHRTLSLCVTVSLTGFSEVYHA